VYFLSGSNSFFFHICRIVCFSYMSNSLFFSYMSNSFFSYMSSSVHCTTTKMIPYYIDVKYTLIRKCNNTPVTLSVIYKQSWYMPGAFGEDHHVGNYMLNNQNACIKFSLNHSAQKRNDMMNPYKTLASLCRTPECSINVTSHAYVWCV
jgi:hypothetical protein